MVLNCLIILEAYIKLRPCNLSCCLCSLVHRLALHRITTLDGFAKSIALLVSLFLHTIGPSSSSPWVTAPSPKRHHYEWAFPRCRCKLCLGNRWGTTNAIMTLFHSVSAYPSCCHWLSCPHLLFSCWLCAWHCSPCTEAHLCSKVSTIRRCFPLDLVSWASCILS
jgi:hypothetical protein